MFLPTLTIRSGEFFFKCLQNCKSRLFKSDMLLGSFHQNCRFQLIIDEE